MYQIIYTEKARKDLRSLDSKINRRIVNKIHDYKRSNRPLDFAKKLHNSSVGTYRFRIGDYRAIFDIDEKGIIKILLILRIKHRKEVYRD